MHSKNLLAYGHAKITYSEGPKHPEHVVRHFMPKVTCSFCHLYWELSNIYHHHPESKKRKSSEANSGSIHPYGRYENAVKTRKTISTIAILWPVKAIFEKRAATVEVDTLISPALFCQRIPAFWTQNLGKYRLSSANLG